VVEADPRAVEALAAVLVGGRAEADVHVRVAPGDVALVHDAAHAEGRQHEAVERDRALEVAHGEVEVVGCEDVDFCHGSLRPARVAPRSD
jgi:hypothetical protein